MRLRAGFGIGRFAVRLICYFIIGNRGVMGYIISIRRILDSVGFWLWGVCGWEMMVDLEKKDIDGSRDSCSELVFGKYQLNRKI